MFQLSSFQPSISQHAECILGWDSGVYPWDREQVIVKGFWKVLAQFLKLWKDFF